MDDKKDLKSKLILLSNKDKGESLKKIELSEEELKIKAKLIEIEKKIDSLENIVESITEELPETFYSSDVFMTIIAGAALTAATNVVNEVFDIKNENEED